MIKIGVIDFFSGCGGASAGFARANVRGASIKIVAGVDNDPHSCATFERNLGAPGHVLDVRKLVSERNLFNETVDRWQLANYDVLVLVGCAPCQGFAAHRKEKSQYDRRKNLFVDFCRLAVRLQPHVIFAENVPDMFSKKNWPFYRTGRKLLEENGYGVRGQIYNFAEFGLPQERFRAVICAARDTAPEMPRGLLSADQFTTVRDAIGHLPPLLAGGEPHSDPMHITSKHRASTIAILEQVPADGGNRPVGVGPRCLDVAREAHGGYTDVYGRLPWDRPSVTITARCRTPSCGRFAHPEQHRGLSVREAALLQGFPADYHFEGPFDDKYKQIGNAVPPLVAQAFAEHLFQHLVKPASGPGPQAAMDQDIVRPVGPGFAVTINGIKRRRAYASA